MGRHVAIKLVILEAHTEKEHQDRDRFLRQLKREAQTAASLRHPGIVTIHHMGRFGNDPYVVMEYVDGSTLESLAGRSGTLDRTEALRILRDVAEALDYAHGKGVIHRDIKPPNIMLAADGTVKICDFGIAKFVESKTASSVLMGTGAYMSPERLQGEAHDGRTDQWSLAIMTYELLTGHLPFQGQNWMWQIVSLSFPDPSQFDPSLAPSVGDVLKKGLAKDPGRRYASCSDFVSSLTRALAGPLMTRASKVNPIDGLTYVWIPPGTFRMGCSPGDTEGRDNEKPPHEVTITQGFWIGQTPVTQEAYERVMGTSPSRFRGPKLPVDKVSWADARRYSEAVGMRLPTEAEWEYAARAGSTGSRYGAVDQIAWYLDNSGGQTHPVSGKQPNAWGLYDMLGNVWEWVAGWYGDYAPDDAKDLPGAAGGQYRVLRGGSWVNGARVARASYRSGNEPVDLNLSIGFRCAGN
jgi:formylglycine-generating enzyme required for sulfatase activity/tRNA A-37 threonylcarbamoyl transferase component Bud32